MRAAALVLALWPMGVSAEMTAADASSRLEVLRAEVAALSAELRHSGLDGPIIAGTALQRLSAIEVELKRLTAKQEELEHQLTKMLDARQVALGGEDPRKRAAEALARFTTDPSGEVGVTALRELLVALTEADATDEACLVWTLLSARSEDAPEAPDACS